MREDRKTILFVDDDANTLNALRRLLSGEPWNILFADSGEKGLEILRTEAVDLVISDVRMPVMDGITLLK